MFVVLVRSKTGVFYDIDGRAVTDPEFRPIRVGDLFDLIDATDGVEVEALDPIEVGLGEYAPAKWGRVELWEEKDTVLVRKIRTMETRVVWAGPNRPDELITVIGSEPKRCYI